MPTNATAPVALIVEDSRIQARVLEHRLAQAGYLVRVAGNGVIALDLIRDQKPDVIISDIEMPKMNGYDLCRAVKSDPSLSDVPVVLLSTLSEAEDIIKGLDAGADNYVTKPYDPTYLLNRVDSLRKSPLRAVDEAGITDLCVTLNGRTYHVKSGRQQVLNLLISTFENAVEKNRELHKLNEQLTLAKEKLTSWNTQLESLNSSLATANDRMSRDLHAAARVQQSLLPDADLDHPNLRIVWKYTPCAELAGDFLNYFLIGDRYLALFVVDVSGHGAASSLLAVAVGRLLTAHASATSLLARQDPFTGNLVITPPAAVVRELNRRFPMEAQGGLYFTIVYGVLDLETYQLNYVNAGHPAMAHVPHGEAPRFLPGDGFPIGLLEDNEWDEHSFCLQPGDRVFQYSDGVPEAMDAELEQLGDDKMLEIMQANASRPLADAITGLHDAVQTWCQPNGPKDDVSILGLDRVM